jgi:hypothetical protein
MRLGRTPPARGQGITARLTMPEQTVAETLNATRINAIPTEVSVFEP